MQARTVDAYTFETLPNGIFLTTWKGVATTEDIRALREIGMQLRAADPDKEQLAIVDAREAEGFHRDARPEMRAFGRDKSWDRVAIVGAKFPVKVTLELFIRALRLMKLEIGEIAFVDSRQEGLAWLESQAPAPGA